jgi:hypothetical protein
VATGEGGDVLIADDPMNPQGARSPIMRQAAKDWLDHTFMTRLNDKRRGCVVLVMQRLHADDVAAYALAKGGWTKLVLPATAMRDEAWEFGGKHFTRRAGELLHPLREDEALLRRAESELGAYAFAAQYQQAPLKSQGAMVKLEWFGRF